MWVWQSQAPAGTSKFTGVAGWEALAKPVRMCMVAPAAIAPIRISRRVSMVSSLGGILSIVKEFRYIVWPQAGKVRLKAASMYLIARRILAVVLLAIATTAASTAIAW